MKKGLLILLPLFSFFLLTPSCQSSSVTLTFVQHTYLKDSHNENGEVNGYYFKNDELAKTEIEYPRGYYLTESDINSFNTDRLKYDVPSLIGDGYFSFTFLTTSFNEDTGFSTDFLEPGTLNHNLVIHFGIYG